MLIAATLVVFGSGFALFNLSQFTHQALLVFDAGNSPSANFLRRDVETVNQALASKQSAEARLAGARIAETQIAKQLAVEEDKLYGRKTLFKQAASDWLVQLHDAEYGKVLPGMDFDNLDANHLLLMRSCFQNRLDGCTGAKLPDNLATVWADVLAQQRVFQNTKVQQKRAELEATKLIQQIATADAQLAATPYGSPAKRAVLTQYQRLPQGCVDAVCLGPDSTLQMLLLVLAVAMGAAGGATLSWIRVVGTDTPTATSAMFWPIPSGALAALIGYFVILFGSTLFSSQAQAAPSPVDPRTVVALSLILGLGGQDALEAFRSIGVALRDLIPKLINRIV